MTLISYIILSILIFCLVFQVFYFLIIILLFLQHKDPISSKKPHIKRLFFLIAVKNEGHQLHRLIQSIKNQKSIIPKIILLNDHSDSENVEELEKIYSLNPELVEIYHVKDTFGKKSAIQEGLLNIDGDILLLDADCEPSSEQWALKMGQKLDESEIILGYGPFFKVHQLLNKLIRFECMWIAAQYFGWCKKSNPYMGVGRNMGIKSTTYKNIKDKIKGNNLISGDDDLLVQAASQKTKIDIITDSSTFVYSMAENTYFRFLKQKSRQITTSIHYKINHKIVLFLDHFTKIIFYCLIPLAFNYLPIRITLSILIFKIFWNLIQYGRIAVKLKEKDLIIIAPIMELIYSLHLIILAVFSVFSNKKVWK